MELCRKHFLNSAENEITITANAVTRERNIWNNKVSFPLHGNQIEGRKFFGTRKSFLQRKCKSLLAFARGCRGVGKSKWKNPLTATSEKGLFTEQKTLVSCPQIKTFQIFATGTRKTKYSPRIVQFIVKVHKSGEILIKFSYSMCHGYEFAEIHGDVLPRTFKIEFPLKTFIHQQIDEFYWISNNCWSGWRLASRLDYIIHFLLVFLSRDVVTGAWIEHRSLLNGKVSRWNFRCDKLRKTQSLIWIKFPVSKYSIPL